MPPIPETQPRENLPGFDLEAGRTWIYPTNYPVRQYQFNIVKSCLFDNTLVSLPTGLGKTFIAAVVMYNFFRWYPQAKIVFMAPTKPLVAQQIEACYKIMGVPQGKSNQICNDFYTFSSECPTNSKFGAKMKSHGAQFLKVQNYGCSKRLKKLTHVNFFLRMSNKILIFRRRVALATTRCLSTLHMSLSLPLPLSL